MIDRLEPEKFFEYNAKLQQKKNALRKALAEKGILQRGGNNTFDGYRYFSESQYKELFTELLTKANLELKSSEEGFSDFPGAEKQPFGRRVRFKFSLVDTETGFYEESYITGEGIDKGDKAGYKAATGALKYFLANTFLVATGDDPEHENKKPASKPAPKPAAPPAPVKRATANQIKTIQRIIPPEKIETLLKYYKITALEELSVTQASAIIQKKGGEQ